MSGEVAQANILVLEVIINQCGMLTNIMFFVSKKELGKDIDEVSTIAVPLREWLRKTRRRWKVFSLMERPLYVGCTKRGGQLTFDTWRNLFTFDHHRYLSLPKISRIVTRWPVFWNDSGICDVSLQAAIINLRNQELWSTCPLSCHWSWIHGRASALASKAKVHMMDPKWRSYAILPS